MKDIKNWIENYGFGDLEPSTKTKLIIMMREFEKWVANNVLEELERRIDFGSNTPVSWYKPDIQKMRHKFLLKNKCEEMPKKMSIWKRLARW